MKNSQQVRIIGGQWRGSKVAVVDSEGLRPTGDRARETLFNWLAADIHGACCLDLFAGTGVLGLEALSRGAASVDAYETSKSALTSLQRVCERLKVEGYQIYARSAIDGVVAPSQAPYDLVFLDPPFGKGLLQKAIDWLQSNKLMAEQGLVYIEQASEEPAPKVPSAWICLKSKRFGAVAVWLYRRVA